MNIQPIQERPGQSPPIATDLMRRAKTFAAPIAVVAARAGIHGRHEHDAGGILQGGVHPRHRDVSIFQGLPQPIQDMPFEFQNFIQK